MKQGMPKKGFFFLKFQSQSDAASESSQVRLDVRRFHLAVAVASFHVEK
jgi:hypothetical protein